MFPWYPREMLWPQAQCLAAYNPSPDKEGKTRRAGATGVHCTSNDFTGLYKQWCIRNQPICDGTHTFCNLTIKPELVQRFGAVMLPSNGKKGNLSAACEWDQFWTCVPSYRNRLDMAACGACPPPTHPPVSLISSHLIQFRCRTETDQYSLFGGSCHLGPPQKTQPGNAKEAGVVGGWICGGDLIDVRTHGTTRQATTDMRSSGPARASRTPQPTTESRAATGGGPTSPARPSSATRGCRSCGTAHRAITPPGKR